jgi:lipoyl(octanoyl) transferase
MTSLVDLGLPVTLADLDTALAETFDEVFGEMTDASAAA